MPEISSTSENFRSCGMASLYLSLLLLSLSTFQSPVQALLVPVSVQEGNDTQCMSAQELQEGNLTTYPAGEHLHLHTHVRS